MNMYLQVSYKCYRFLPLLGFWVKTTYLFVLHRNHMLPYNKSTVSVESDGVVL